MCKFLRRSSTRPSFLPKVTRPFFLLEGGVWGWAAIMKILLWTLMGSHVVSQGGGRGEGVAFAASDGYYSVLYGLLYVLGKQWKLWAFCYMSGHSPTCMWVLTSCYDLYINSIIIVLPNCFPLMRAKLLLWTNIIAYYFVIRQVMIL